MKYRRLLAFVMATIMLTSCIGSNDDSQTIDGPQVTPIVLPSNLDNYVAGTDPEDLDCIYHFIRYDYLLSQDPQLAIDASAGKIVGEYSNITFDVDILTDESNLPEVNIYEMIEKEYQILNARGWEDYYIPFYQTLMGYDTYDFDHNIIYAHENEFADSLAASIEVIDISSNDSFTNIRNKYESRIQPTDDNMMHFVIPTSVLVENGFSGLNEDSEEQNFYVMRPIQDGLPVTTSFPKGSSKVISWDANKYVGMQMDSSSSIYSNDESCFVFFYGHKLEMGKIIEENLQVLPIEDCISSSIGQIQHDSRMLNNPRITIVAAELTYANVYEWNWYGRSNIRIADSGELYTLFMPVWSVYYLVESDSECTKFGVVFINAITGEGMELDYSAFQPYEENFDDYK